jgi:hypothetical protein
VRFAVPQAEQERSHPQHLAAAQHEAQVGFCLGLNWGQHLETFNDTFPSSLMFTCKPVAYNYVEFRNSTGR